MPFCFIKSYLFERNILNCKNGFYWSVLHAFYYFLEFIKIKDLQSKVLERK